MFASRLSIIDLAGSESCRRTGEVGVRVEEAAWINKSHSTLERCIKIIRNNRLRRTNEHT